MIDILCDNRRFVEFIKYRFFLSLTDLLRLSDKLILALVDRSQIGF